MADESQISAAELAARAEDYLHSGTLTPDDYESLKHHVAELSRFFTDRDAYFILGSYGEAEIGRLRAVKDRINRHDGSYAFLMIDIRREWTNTYLKFRILADYTDVIIGVAEHDRGGFLVEQGYFTALEKYFVKTHVFKREYDGIDPATVDTEVALDSPFSAMQTDVFEMLAEAGRLCTWMTEAELLDCTDAVI